MKNYQSEQRAPRWGAATFRGITVGKSDSSELRREWGKPESTGNWDWDDPKKPKYLLYHYKIQEKYTATVTVEVETRTGKVIAMSMSPDGMTIEQAVVIFGEDYSRTRYAFCECDLGDGSPIFEASDGSVLYLEYRLRGIAIAVNDAGMATTILFVNKPIGLKSLTECQKVTGCLPPK
jgi:hypothetical protein